MKKTILLKLAMALLVTGLVSVVYAADSEAVAPIADAGLPRYAAQDPIILDGTGSYDPDSSGALSYTWRQIGGPSVGIIDANTATPTVSGFVQTDAIQVCEFELVVSDGQLESLPDLVTVSIVPEFGPITLTLANSKFNPNKPTFIYFSGGDCVTGFGQQWGSGDDFWYEKANVICFLQGYEPDGVSLELWHTYHHYGDMLIVYLSSVAPDYSEMIQTSGWSTGGQPALDTGIRLNRFYADPRYAVNRVSLFDATTVCRGAQGYSESIANYSGSSVDGEQCWVDNYLSYNASYYPNILNVGYSTVNHTLAPWWFYYSITTSDSNVYNNGIIAGAYYSVVGPGKNLQLASTPEAQIYKFKWFGESTSGHMELFDEQLHPGKLPAPVMLVGPVDAGDPNGAILTCEESENAVGYQLLFGSNPYRIMDYAVISDTPTPPDEIITTLPFEKTWWTVRVYDEHGSTIYADPKPIGIVNLSFPIENISTGKRYGYIQDAIDDAVSGDEIVVKEEIYRENIDFKGKNLTVRSTDPNDPNVVATTVINGVGQRPVVTLSHGQGAGCVLAGLTITGGTVGISCGDASPTIRNCTIESTGTNSIEFLYGNEPIIIDCNILGPIREVYDPSLVALWKMNETEGSIAYDSIGVNDGICHGEPLWQPAGGKLAGALEFDGINDYVSADFVLNPRDGAFSAFAWIQGGVPGQVIISQSDGLGSGETWLGMDALGGNLMTGLVPPTVGRFIPQPLGSQSIITDGLWHHVGFVWDGSYRVLYVDGIEVAKDTAAQAALKSATGGIYFGTNKNLDATSLFSGLIDDVRIYDVALTAEEIEALVR